MNSLATALLAAVSWIPLVSLAGEAPFTVDIAPGTNALADRPASTEPVPGMMTIFLPGGAATSPMKRVGDGSHFYVVLRNTADKPVEQTMKASDWFVCFAFEIRLASGKTSTVSHVRQLWSWNPKQTRSFAAKGCQVFVIDFSDGDWQGLPADVKEPTAAKMTAIFYHGLFLPGPDRFLKRDWIKSAPVDVLLVRR